MRLPFSVCEGKALQNIALNSEHLFFFIRFGMVETEQVKETVGGQ